MSHSANIASALSKLPAFSGPTWRAANFEVAGPFALETPLATSRSLPVATQNFTLSGVHLFLSSEGRDVSLFSASSTDQEVVLLPGATFAPVSTFIDIAGLRVQMLLGIPAVGQRTLAVPAHNELAALVDDARRAPAVNIASPGRFGP